MDRACSDHRRNEKYVRNFGCKFEGMRAIRSPSGKWENNIKINVRDVGLEDVGLAQDTHEWSVL
jgi:hypothetical protein